MQGRSKETTFRPALFTLAIFLVAFIYGWAKATYPLADQVQAGWKNITGPALMDTVRELCSEKYAGRLTGTKGYNDAAAWVAGRLAGWGLLPAGDNGTYYQDFPDPYTLVLPGAELSLLKSAEDGSVEKKSY
jgi:hypothetical protein